MRERCDFDYQHGSLICTRITDKFPDFAYGPHALRCDSCEIKVFGFATFPHENNLISFNASNCKIESVTSNALSNMKFLQHVYLSHNRISNISKDAFWGLKDVQDMYLDHNELKGLTEGFLNNFQTNLLILSNNLIEEIPPGVFEGFLGTLSLDLSHNQVHALYVDSFLHLDGLEILDLSYNKLCSLPLGAFKHVQTLQQLNLSHNKFKSFSFGIFSPLIHLNHLNLSHNNFGEFEANVLIPLTSLKLLDISSNGLRYIDAQSLHDNSKSLRRLVIADNFWECMGLVDVVRYLSKMKISVHMETESRYEVMNVNGVACSAVPLYEDISIEAFLEMAWKMSTKKLYC